MEDNRKYNHMENVFQYINTNYISLNEKLVKKHNKIINKLCDNVTAKMKEVSPMFKKMFVRIYYGGSYYDGLKIGDPGEYDYDLLLKIPVLAKPLVQMAEYPGFVQVQLTNLSMFRQQPEFKQLSSDLEKELLDGDKYVRVDKMRQWMESVITVALSKLPQNGGPPVLEVDGVEYYFKYTKGGPAFTIHISELPKGDPFLSVDLVPCFEFVEADWPADPEFRRAKDSNKSFFVVPKKPTQGGTGFDRYWRLSFQQQETDLLENRNTLKPALKLLKLYRDKWDHKCVSSYFIKTIFLWEVETGDNSLWKCNLSTVFIKMLRRYYDYLKDHNIPYFWDRRFNLLTGVKDITLDNISNKVGKTIADIDRNSSDPFVVAPYLVPLNNLEEMKKNVALGKKFKRSLTSTDSSPQSCSSTSSASNADAVSDMKEMNEKIDRVLTEQRHIKSLLQQVAKQQQDICDHLWGARSRENELHELMLKRSECQ